VAGLLMERCSDSGPRWAPAGLLLRWRITRTRPPAWGPIAPAIPNITERGQSSGALASVLGWRARKAVMLG